MERRRGRNKGKIKFPDSENNFEVETFSLQFGEDKEKGVSSMRYKDPVETNHEASQSLEIELWLNDAPSKAIYIKENSKSCSFSDTRQFN